MKKLIIIPLLSLLISTTLAQEFISHTNTVKNGYNFWVYTPVNPDSSAEIKPLVLFLHGASLCGNNLSRVMRYGPLDALKRGLILDALVVAPQNPGGAWSPEKIMNVLNWVKENYGYDEDQLYVIGMSLGGYGTLDFVGTYPEKVAAAMAMCGGANLRQGYCGLNEVPLWILHGTADRDVGLKESQKVVNAMKNCGYTDRLIFTKLQGVDHGGPARLFYINEVYDWLFEHRLTDPDRPVNTSYTITPESMKNPYRKLTPRTIPVRSGNKNDSKKTEGIDETNEESTSPDTTASPKPATGEKRYHTIKKGDTLGKIAQNNHTTVKKLCQLNNIKETTLLQIGKKLRVK
ncbi:MAG: LysM peptidoglycan-binding domain-containing protein [Bacteroidales bacterium]|nr:LysM peptidoglycan-binding domain-containing protein [Bacteroidales bacterium]